MAANTTSNHANLGVFVNRTCLAVAQPQILTSRFGRQESLPSKNSNVVKFRRYERLSPTTGLVPGTVKSVAEGVVPGDVNPTSTDVTVTLAQYGNISRLTDVVGFTSFEDANGEYIKRNAENMAQTIERIYWAGISAGTQVFYATDSIGTLGAGGRSTVNGKINGPALDKIIRTLRKADTKPLNKQLNPSGNIGTQGIRAGYVAFITPEIKYDLEQNVSGYMDVSKYPAGGAQEGEVGAYKEIRFFESTLASSFAAVGALLATGFAGVGNNDVHLCIVFGAEAYATVKLAEASQSYYIPATQTDHSNPLGQFSSIGWKAYCAAKILNENWIVRLEVGVSA